MDKIIGLKELRENTESFIKAVQEKGSSFLVLRRSKPIFKISPVSEEESGWETVIDFTTINKEGVPLKDVLSNIRSWTSSKNRSKS